jgi:hypothetical protein
MLVNPKMKDKADIISCIVKHYTSAKQSWISWFLALSLLKFVASSAVTHTSSYHSLPSL